MIKFCLIVFLCSFAIVTDAAEKPSTSYEFYLNPEVRSERGEGQMWVFRQPINIGFGVNLSTNTLGIVELSQFTEKSGNETLLIYRIHQEAAAWINQRFYDFDLWNLFYGAGFGAYRESVRTTLSGSTTTDVGTVLAMGGASFGLRGVFRERFIFSTEARLIGGRNFDPNPQLALVMRLGVRF